QGIAAVDWNCQDITLGHVEPTLSYSKNSFLQPPVLEHAQTNKEVSYVHILQCPPYDDNIQQNFLQKEATSLNNLSPFIFHDNDPSFAKTVILPWSLPRSSTCQNIMTALCLFLPASLCDDWAPCPPSMPIGSSNLQRTRLNIPGPITSTTNRVDDKGHHSTRHWCHLCNANFYAKKGLNRHIKDKHLPWNGRRYSFEKHLRSRHKDDLGYPRGVCNPRRTT
ncbi:hypothetical protein BGW80DRAFT_1290823, partial [Lactifluus volemus]